MILPDKSGEQHMILPEKSCGFWEDFKKNLSIKSSGFDITTNKTRYHQYEGYLMIIKSEFIQFSGF
jgi:hypothetical protein